MSRKTIGVDDGVLEAWRWRETDAQIDDLLHTGERLGRTSYTGTVWNRIFAGPACCRIFGVVRGRWLWKWLGHRMGGLGRRVCRWQHSPRYHHCIGGRRPCCVKVPPLSSSFGRKVFGVGGVVGGGRRSCFIEGSAGERLPNDIPPEQQKMVRNEQVRYVYFSGCVGTGWRCGISSR